MVTSSHLFVDFSCYVVALLCISCLPLITNSKVHEVNIKFCSNCSEVVVFRKREWYNFDDSVHMFQKFSYPRNLASAAAQGTKRYPHTDDRARPATRQLPSRVMDACRSISSFSSLRAIFVNLPRHIVQTSANGGQSCTETTERKMSGGNSDRSTSSIEWLWHYVSYSTFWLSILPIFSAIFFGLKIYHRGDEMKSSLRKEIDAQTDEISELREELENLRALTTRNEMDDSDAAKILCSVMKSLNDCEAQMKKSKFSTRFTENYEESEVPLMSEAQTDQGRMMNSEDDPTSDTRTRLRGEMPDYFDTIYTSQDLPREEISEIAMNVTCSDGKNISRKLFAEDLPAALPMMESLNGGNEVQNPESEIRGPSHSSDFKKTSTSLLHEDHISSRSFCIRAAGQGCSANSRGGGREEEGLIGSEDSDFDRIYFCAMRAIKEKLASDLLAAQQESIEFEFAIEKSARTCRRVSLKEGNPIVRMAVAAIEDSEGRMRVAAVRHHSQIPLVGENMRKLSNYHLRGAEKPNGSSQCGEDFGARGEFAFTVVNAAALDAKHCEDLAREQSSDRPHLDGEPRAGICHENSPDVPTNINECDADIDEYTPDWTETASDCTALERAVSDSTARRFSCSLSLTPPLSPLSINEYSSPLSCNTNVESVSTAVVCTHTGTFYKLISPTYHT